MDNKTTTPVTPFAVPTAATPVTPAPTGAAPKLAPKPAIKKSPAPPTAHKARAAAPASAKTMNDIAELALKRGIFATDQNKIQLAAVTPQNLFPPTREIIHNEVAITVNPKLPAAVLVEAVEWAINIILGDKPYISGPMRAFIKQLVIIKYYTNIDISIVDSKDCTPEIFYSICDAVRESGDSRGPSIIERVEGIVDVDQVNFIHFGIDETIDSVLDYRRSAVGIIDQLADRNADDHGVLESALKVLSEGEQSEGIQTLLAAYKKLS